MLCGVQHTLREMWRDTSNSWGKPPKCHLFSNLRQKSGLLVMKLEIWIKWFIISLIYIQDISQKFSVSKNISYLKRTDSTERISLPSPHVPHTALPNIALPAIRLSQGTTKDVSFKWGLSSQFLLSSEPCAKGAVPSRGCCDGGETGLFLLPRYSGPLDDDDDDERTRRGIWGVKQINFNAIQLIQSQ